MMIHIIIQGTPIAKKRPRFVTKKGFSMAYNCQATEEGRWLLEAKSQIPSLIQGPVKMICIFKFPRPKSHFGTGRNASILKRSSPINHIIKPDLDNCIKFVKDCLNQVAWHDDCQVDEIIAKKEYAGENETAHTEITIFEARMV